MNTDWLLEQWLIAIVGAVLFVLLMMAMLVTKASITRRRFALLFLVVIIFSTAIWVLNGAIVSPDRTLTLIASCRTDKNKLEAGIKAFPDNYARLVLFTTDTGNFDACTTLLDELAASLPVEGGEPVVLPPGTGSGPSGDTLPSLIKALETAETPSLMAPWRSFLDMFAIRTRVFMFDPVVSDWETLMVSPSPDAVRTLFHDFYGDLFLYEVNTEGAAYRGSIAFGEGLHANKKMGWMLTPVDLRLTGGPMSTGDIEVDICLSVDRSSSFQECESSTGKHRILLSQVKLWRESGDPPTWRWFLPGDEDRPILSDLLNTHGKNGDHNDDLRSHELVPGWHSLEVRMRFKNASHASQELPPVVHFFQVERAGPAFVIGKEQLANRAWPVSIPATGSTSTTSGRSVANLLLETIYSPSDKLSGRFADISLPPQIPPGLPKIGHCILTEKEDINVIKGCAKDAGSLVLVEPSLQFLRTITNSNLPQQLSQRGAGILVIGPPPLEPTDEPTIGNWLPAWPQQNAPKIHTLRDVVLIADCSGLAHIPIDDTVDSMLKTNAIRPIEFQRNIVEKLRDKLTNLPDIKGTTIAKYSTGEDAVLRFEYAQDWRPAVQVQINPGCLKASKKEMENALELVEFASVEQRIHAFLSKTEYESHGPFAAFHPGDRHPGSVIVVFSTQAAQLFASEHTGAKRKGGAVDAGKLQEDWTAETPPPDLLERLKNAGIRVLVVELPTGPVFAMEADTRSGGASWSKQLEAWKTQNLVEVIRLSSKNEADYAERLISEIGLGSTAPKPELKRTSFGRSLDPRVPETIPTVPLVFSPLLNKATSARVLVKADPASGLALVDAPLIVERNDAGAPVVALGYSPFEPVAWVSDLQSPDMSSKGLEAVCGASCELSDWIQIFILHRPPSVGPNRQSSALGVQRVFDIVEQASRKAAEPDQLRLVSVSLTSSGDAVDFRFALPAISWKDPTLKLRDPKDHCGPHAPADACPLSLLALDPLAGTVTYRFSTLKGLPLDRYSLVGSVSPKVELPLWLSPRQNLTTDGAKSRNLLNNAGATRITGYKLPPAQRSALALATWILLFATLLLFSPLVRPWHALSRFWQRRRTEVQPVSFDAEIVSERAGYLLAVYEASRRSGDPAWLRRFQAGDSLSRAISADLLAFTPLGSQMRLACRPPRMRLREIGESFDLVIGIDDAPAMCHPGDWHGHSRKRTALEALITVIATTVIQQGGRWTVVGLRSKEQITKLIGDDDPKAVAASLAVFFESSHGTHSLLSNHRLPGTAVRLLISDFLSADLADYVDWIGGNGNGAILITDPAQADELGVGRDAARGTIYDRSVWERGDAAELLHRQRLEARYAVEQSGARFAEVDVDASSFEVAEALYNTGILQMAKR